MAILYVQRRGVAYILLNFSNFIYRFLAQLRAMEPLRILNQAFFEIGKFYKQMEERYKMADFSWAADHASREGTMAALMDRLISSCDRIEDIIRQVTAESQKRGHKTMYTETPIRSHIKFRIQQASANKGRK